LKNIKGVFFDFDGVLIDSLPAMRVSWKVVKESYNITPDFDEFSKYIGIPFLSILDKLKIDKKDFLKIKKKYSEVASKNISLIKLNPYVIELLYWLRNKKIKLAIVTSKDFVRTMELIEFFDIKVDAVVTPEQTLRGKPYPDPLFKAANMLDCNIKESIFIGDMLSDMKAASRAECLYLHYTNGYQKLTNKNYYGGSIDSLIEIIEFIRFF
tara:strand:+ start:1358 stop:1990 length:633 start_codon:yes stop_codon:yes gene_type:complete